MDNNEIINSIVNLLSDIEDATTICYNDFTEERKFNMIVIGIDGVEQVNFQLPDYSYDMTILVDTFIDDDNNGTIFKSTVDEVQDRINTYVMDKTLLDDLFGDLCVVYFNVEKFNFSITEKSNRFEAKLKIIQSK